MVKSFLPAAATLLATTLPVLATSSTPKIQWVNCTEHVPGPLQGATLPTTLPASLHCGLLAVPMDYSKPISSRNNITLGFAMNRPENPQGLLNFNPGGPNSEVASYAWALSLNISGVSAAAGLEGFDFLAMDTRGTYQSNPLNCSFDNLTFSSYIPSTKEEFASYQGLMSTFAKSCIEGSTPPGIVEFIGSAEMIQDWNSLRVALGYKKMSHLGISYGTLGGALYASTYPQHVENFVLDAITPRRISNVDQAAYQVNAVNRLLLRADAYCLNDTSCPFHAEGKGAIPKAFAAVVSQAAAGNTSSTNVSASDVRAVVTLAYLSLNPNFPGLNDVLYGALNGNWAALQWAGAYGPGYMQSLLPSLTTMCLDQHIDDNTWEGFHALTKAAFAGDTAKIEFSQQLSIIGLCGGWPWHGNSNGPIIQAVPLLLVTSDFDLNTPTESATLEFELAKHSTLVVRHGDDHGTITVPGPAQSAEIEFLQTGKFPQATNETYMTVYEPGSTRAQIPSPYDVPLWWPLTDLFNQSLSALGRAGLCMTAISKSPRLLPRALPLRYTPPGCRRTFSCTPRTRADRDPNGHTHLQGSARLFADAAREEAAPPPPPSPRLAQLEKAHKDWDGDEPLEHAVLRMLVDKHKPLRTGTVRTAEEKIRASNTNAPAADWERVAAAPLLPATPGHRPWHTTYKAPAHTQDSVRLGRVPAPMPVRAPVHGDERARRREQEARRRGAVAGRLGRAREGVLDYRLGAGAGAGGDAGGNAGGEVRQANPVTMRGWASLVEDKIEANYDFIGRDAGRWADDLPEREEFLMNRILQRNGASPPWVDIQGELEQAVVSFREILRQSWTRRALRTLTLSAPAHTLAHLTAAQAAALRDPEWELRERGYHDAALASLNALVRKYNGAAPYAVRRPLYVRDAELQRAYADAATDIVRGIEARAGTASTSTSTALGDSDAASAAGDHGAGAGPVSPWPSPAWRMREVVRGWLSRWVSRRWR
ncbi:hypothetical protein HWV62_25526 [Athelia sp. TMB]|nr:hypothetical protein HWV62_25526 [Athelia sp. TMB]